MHSLFIRMDPTRLFDQVAQLGLQLESRGRCFAVCPGSRCPDDLRGALQLNSTSILAELERRADSFAPKTVEVPVSDIELCEDLPNFKRDADRATGVVHGQELQGSYSRRGTGPVDRGYWRIALTVPVPSNSTTRVRYLSFQ